MALKSCCIPQRYVFAIMGFFATLIGFMIRISVELTISHMVNETISTEAVYDAQSCPDMNIAVNQSEIFGTAQNQTEGTFEWSALTQASVVSSYRGSYIMSQFIGGMAADVSGGKKILGGSLLVSSVATFMLPFAAKWFGSTGVVVLRFFTGLAGGTIIPVLLSMMSKWVPQDERAFVASIIFPGALIGHVAASYLAHPLMQLAGWEAVYYAFGIIGFLWFVVWLYTCFSTPNEHPNISESEKDYLNKTLDALIRTSKNDLDPLPWKAYLRCVPFWTCVVGYTGREWAFTTLTTQIPQFMQDVLRLDISRYIHLSYLPYVCMWIFALIFGFASYILVARGFCSIKFIRKFSTSFAAVGSSLCIILIAYSGCNAVLATFWMFLGMMVLGAYYSGVMINMLDMNPNYAGTMIGVVDNIAINSVLLLPMFNKLVITDALLSQWRISLWLVFCVIIISLPVFLYYVRTDQMWWDDVRKNGYPTNWKNGLFPTEALIGENGETVFKPRRDAETSEDKL